MSCKGICVQYKADFIPKIGYYARGCKRCQTCDIYVNWEGLRCPCCSSILRVGPRLPANKQRLKELKQ